MSAEGGKSLMKSFHVRYHDLSYLVRLHERLGVDAQLRPDEWQILYGNRMIAAIDYRDLEVGRVLTVLSTRIR